MTDIQTTVVGVVAEAAGVTTDDLLLTATLKDTGIASLDAIEILFQLEEKFDVLLSEKDVDLGVATVADLVRTIKAAIARKQGQLQPAPTA